MKKSKSPALAVRTKYIECALTGDTVKARALIQFSAAALTTILDSKDISEIDRVTLDFLRNALRNYCDGMPIDRALCIESDPARRGPKIKPDLRMFIFLDVVRALDLQSGSTKNVNLALDMVANTMGGDAKHSTVKSAWQRYGGMSAYKQLRKDN